LYSTQVLASFLTVFTFNMQVSGAFYQPALFRRFALGVSSAVALRFIWLTQLVQNPPPFFIKGIAADFAGFCAALNFIFPAFWLSSQFSFALQWFYSRSNNLMPFIRAGPGGCRGNPPSWDVACGRGWKSQRCEMVLGGTTRR
jgi:hypothetical protein